jgi:hypothetical protein
VAGQWFNATRRPINALASYVVSGAEISADSPSYRLVISTLETRLEVRDIATGEVVQTRNVPLGARSYACLSLPSPFGPPPRGPGR